MILKPAAGLLLATALALMLIRSPSKPHASEPSVQLPTLVFESHEDPCWKKLRESINSYLKYPSTSLGDQTIELSKFCENKKTYARVQFAIRMKDLRWLERQTK